MRNVYLDTTIPSFLVTTRDDALSAARRQMTLRFWESYAERFRLFVSAYVEAEIAAGQWPGREDALARIAALPRLPVTPAVDVAVATYIRTHLMPADAEGDAAHLACASVHGMDVLLTWNVRHLANPLKVDRLQVINRRLGLVTPVLCTPEALLEDDDA
ncbi:MAG: type II toxin-antitoxin system VapC family toxin [Deltaproteobacteria bacterium]|nr:type II toxin-antitoxin system VapC family toxin [Deltaproteobacteria bacterium]